MEILERIYIALCVCVLCALLALAVATACGLVLLVAYTVKRVKNRRADDGTTKD